MNMIEKTGRKFDLPLEYAAGMYRIEMTGDSEVRIEHHRGVGYYEPELIIVKRAGGEIKIRGSSLTLQMMTDEELRITGHIDGIDLERQK